MKYQAIIIDLDGTLLNDNNQICVNNIEAVQQALYEGYQVTLASGRPHQLMLPFAKQLGITAPMICCNGAYQYDVSSNSYQNVQSLSSTQLAQLLDTLILGQFDFTLYAHNGIYALKTSQHFAGLKCQMSQFDIDVQMAIMPSLAELQDVCGEVYKVLVSSSDKQALCQLRDSINNVLQADLSIPNKLDITCLGVNKGLSALTWLSQHNLSPNLTIAFGDGDNDISLFKAVGEPVAMANASPALRGLANLIITDNNSCGIGQYLRLIIREGQHAWQHSYSY
ncbi:HAD family hydrolase [Thaumasiovibrio sp. DFM-14]|uniref:HAD family hydrolase n=1 Tax=Thaumasiovibrio sp. DFM-14 TaxID=3384792 RepID=UPI0039A04193